MNAYTPNISTSFVPGAENTRQLRAAFGRFATGVTIVTATSPDGPVGITANSFSSVSLDPPLVLWAPGKSSRRFVYFEAAEHYAVHVLGADQLELCTTFSKNAFALGAMTHVVNEFGVPLIQNCLARFECRRIACHEGGDHVIVLGEVHRAEMREGDALTFFAGNFGKTAQA